MNTEIDNTAMYTAVINKDPAFEGIFFYAVTTTGIFCRPTCAARKPNAENILFFRTTRDALLHGYRPCKLCKPLSLDGKFPDWLSPLMDEIEKDPSLRFTAQDLKGRNIEPNRLRRWFLKQYGMTFQMYLKTVKTCNAFESIKMGEKVTDAAFSSGYDSLSGFTDSFKKVTGFSPIQSRTKRLLIIDKILTPLGPMIAGAIDEGICMLFFADSPGLKTQQVSIAQSYDATPVPGHHRLLEMLNQEITEYFNGTRQEFTVPILIKSTPFQEKVWQALCTIPYGATRSYKEQAEAVGNPKAIRAVAHANGDNRISIVVPCHRVIGSDGTLTGFGGGLWRKRFLLDLESNHSTPARDT